MDDTLKDKKDQFMCSKYKERVLIALNIGGNVEDHRIFIANGSKNGHYLFLTFKATLHIIAIHLAGMFPRIYYILLKAHLVV